ncbi:MAG: hypothetical protein AAGK37_21870 [Pseudomonadota bacterium]
MPSPYLLHLSRIHGIIEGNARARNARKARAMEGDRNARIAEAMESIHEGSERAKKSIGTTPSDPRYDRYAPHSVRRREKAGGPRIMTTTASRGNAGGKRS